VPEDVWRRLCSVGEPEAWANPMAPFYLLTWTPHEDDLRTLEEAARWATSQLWKTRAMFARRQGPARAKVQEWWATSESMGHDVGFLGGGREAKGNGSPSTARWCASSSCACGRRPTSPTTTVRPLTSLRPGRRAARIDAREPNPWQRAEDTPGERNQRYSSPNRTLLSNG
jgi:hypothetical protein